MSSLLHDLRFALRRLRQAPAFTSLAVLSLALGVGANTAVFSLLDAVVLRPLRLPEPERLVRIYSGREGRPYRSSNYADFVDYRRQGPAGDGSEAFTGMAAFVPWSFSLSFEGKARLVEGELVSSDYFEVLRVVPRLGTGLRDLDDEGGVAARVVVSHDLWRGLLARRRDLTGVTLELSGVPFAVAGVAPEGFRGITLDSRPQLWIALDHYPEVATGFWANFDAADYEAQRRERRRISMWQIVGRLHPAATLATARAELEVVDARLAETYPSQNAGQTARLAPALAAAVPLVERRTSMRFLLLLQVAVAATLFIACANVGGLLLAQGQSRRPELAIRLAIGGSRARLLRQLLTENLLLALLGGAAALLAGQWILHLFGRFHLPGGIPVSSLATHLDSRVLAATLCLALLSGALLSLVPALQTAALASSARIESGGIAAGPREGRLRDVLVAVQIALAMVLLLGTGLLVRSLRHALQTDLGFEPRNVLTVTIDLGLHRYDAPRAEGFYGALAERVRALPAVEGASLTSAPFSSLEVSVGTVSVPERGRVTDLDVHLNRIDPTYLTTMGIPLLGGRGLDSRDRAGAEGTLVLNQSLARLLWPNESAVGKRLNFSDPDGTFLEVVGVAADTRLTGLEDRDEQMAYLPVAQHWRHAAGNEMTLVVRTAGRPLALAAQIGDLVASLDPDVAISRTTTMADRVAGVLQPQRMGSALLGALAMMAVLLAALGTLGVVGYSVTVRSPEIGLRMALGAGTNSVVAMFLRRGLAAVVAGLFLGIAAALPAGRLIEGFLYDVTPLDAGTLVAVLLLLLVIGGLAALLPALRAARIDPMQVLRSE